MCVPVSSLHVPVDLATYVDVDVPVDLDLRTCRSLHKNKSAKKNAATCTRVSRVVESSESLSVLHVPETGDRSTDDYSPVPRAPGPRPPRSATDSTHHSLCDFDIFDTTLH